MFRWLCVAALLAGCGAKTGAEVDPAAEREPEPFDAGFDTFPCRWSLAQPTVVEVGETPVTNALAAIHATRDEALLTWERDGTFHGARLMLADPPPVLERFGPAISPDPALNVLHGVQLADPSISWVGDPGFGCNLRVMGEGPPWREALALTPAISCTIEPHDPRRVDLTLIDLRQVRLWSAHDLDSPTVRSVPVAEAAEARSVRVEGRGWMLFTLEAGELVVRRVTESSVERAVLATAFSLSNFEAAPDRVRGGAVTLRREGDVWRLQRIPFDGPLRALDLADLESLSPMIFGFMATNETEAMLPLWDGRVAVVPLDGSAIRFIGPVPVPARVVLRPGSSGGGLVYELRDGDEHHLVFQPLTCNR